MQRWEYCAITGFRPMGDGITSSYPTLITFTTNGLESLTREIRGYDEATKVAALIAQLGEEGWEMVGCSDQASITTHVLYFKRPKL